MNWSNVRLILLREVRDQLRDRRTLFMIAVLPMLLYPLLGTAFFQLMQFVREHPTKVWVIGAENVADMPPLLEPRKEGEPPDRTSYFAANLFADEHAQHLIEVDTRPVAKNQSHEDAAKQALHEGVYDAVVVFPPDFAERLREFRATLRASGAHAEKKQPTITVPEPEILNDTSKEKSKLAVDRMASVLRQWTDDIGQQNLKDSNVPQTAARPFKFGDRDVAEQGHRNAALWSKLLPFVLLIWALTGAFYPAIDLCAGEKERGTLETLLSSPAERSEIVTGKLLTIMLFSMATSLLNLLSMGVTGGFVMQQLGSVSEQWHVAPPPLEAPLWLFLALAPVSALFSALCLALAAFARSTKEGQYYLMPLLLVTMPLMILPMAPGVEMNLGNSLIPVTGVVLLLRMLLEGNYAQALPYVLPVVAVTLACCLLAMRWAIDQFNSESVLFRESERLDLGLWLKHLMRDRDDTPTVGAAVLCSVLILVIRFFLSLKFSPPTSFAEFATQTGVLQITAVLTPVLIMTVMLTRKPLATLLLARFSGATAVACGAAMALALAVHPLIVALQGLVHYLYPLSDQTRDSMKPMEEFILKGAPAGIALLVIAVMPAICEELAFRGFILSGFRHLGHRWRAIVFSALLFGFTHMIIQQSLITSAIGMVIGYIAVQSDNLLPGMFFHCTHNALIFFTPRWLIDRTKIAPASAPSWLEHYVVSPEGTYQPIVLALGVLGAAVLLWWFHGLTHSRSQEETLQDAIEVGRLRVERAEG